MPLGSPIPQPGPAQEAFTEALLTDDPEALYERAPCGYLTTSPDGRIVKVNGTFLSWTGFAREEIVGQRTFSSLLTAGGRIYHETHYAPLLRMQGSVREIALDILTATKDRLPVLVNAVLERDSAGDPVLIRVAAFDATERREYERELLRAKQRAESSEAQARSLAQTLQQTLIPPLLPAVPGLDIAAAFRPAGSGAEVGGDFYDVFQIADDDWVVVLGDVCGKGVEAAVITALVRYTIRAVSVQTADPAEALGMVNDVLLAHGTDRFCTVLLTRLRRLTVESAWQATICAGGHPLPLLIRGDEVASVGIQGRLVGALPTEHREETTLTLVPGDALVLFTDGVTEARQGGHFYEDQRLSQVLGGQPGPAKAIVDALLADVLHYQEEAPRDDIAVVALLVPPAQTGGGFRP